MTERSDGGGTGAGAHAAVEARGVAKRFGEVVALDGLDLVAPPGLVTALLGPNGSGKTTFVSAVATLLRPSAGELRVCGVDVVRHPRRVRRLIGFAGQFASIEPAMTGRENLDMIARLFGRDRRAAAAAAASTLERLGLADAGDRLVREYSGGMRRRLDLGASLVGEPRLLLMDEPTTGLDPRSRVELWDLVRGLVGDGMSVLLTTQYLEEADQLAGHVVIVDRGRTVASGPPADLKASAGADVIELRARTAGDVPAVQGIVAGAVGGPARVDPGTRRVAAAASAGQAQLADVVRRLGDAGIAVDEIAVRPPTLDEVFLALTGRPGGPPPSGPAGRGNGSTRGNGSDGTTRRTDGDRTR